MNRQLPLTQHEKNCRDFGGDADGMQNQLARTQAMARRRRVHSQDFQVLVLLYWYFRIVLGLQRIIGRYNEELSED